MCVYRPRGRVASGATGATVVTVVSVVTAARRGSVALWLGEALWLCGYERLCGYGLRRRNAVRAYGRASPSPRGRALRAPYI